MAWAWLAWTWLAWLDQQVAKEELQNLSHMEAVTGKYGPWLVLGFLGANMEEMSNKHTLVALC